MWDDRIMAVDRTVIYDDLIIREPGEYWVETWVLHGEFLGIVGTIPMMFSCGIHIY